MKQFISKVASLFVSLGLLTANCFAGAPSLAQGLAPMLQKVLPAVVNIRAQIKITDFATLERLQKERGPAAADQPVPDQVLSIGSGVIVDANKGYILTNAHVVNDAPAITVTLSDGRHYTAKLIGLDKPSDVALLQIQAKNLTSIPMSDSSTLQVGDTVAAIGNPFGLNQSVTSGIVSALGRTTLGIESFENFIQTDAPINPGNSGGALINASGQLIGINTAILTPARGSVGIGFAIPSNMARSVMQQLIEFGNVKRGALGVGVQDVTPDLAGAFNLSSPDGAAVTLVIPYSPAALAGMKVGDIITGINNNPVKNANDLVNSVAFLRVNSKANINILRGNKAITVYATLTDPEQTKLANEQKDPFLYGMSLKDFTLTSPVHGDIKGVLIVSVDEDSNAWHADLHPGDVITSANQQPVNSIDDLRKIASSADQSMLLNVLRGPGAIFLVINKEGPAPMQQS